MNILLLSPDSVPISVSNYISEVSKYIDGVGGKVLIKNVNCKDDDIGVITDNCDLVWVPYLTGGMPPPRCISGIISKPVVVTLHGAATHTVPLVEYYDTVKGQMFGLLVRIRNKMFWWQRRKYVRKIITVSSYAKNELCQTFKFSKDIVFPIYHGVDHSIYNVFHSAPEVKPYFLHVSSWQPKKNVKNIVESYKQLREVVGGGECPDLLLVTPGSTVKFDGPGITHSVVALTPSELKAMYRGAFAFLFPSKHESFGMPLVEAMACGCLVITSNSTACEEIVGDAGILVNPYCVRDLSEAMRHVLNSPETVAELQRKAVERAKEFQWSICGEKHAELFRSLL